ncbi:MAG: response regulator transcription factor [Syntrophales bacterium]|nr:response regulator transcription factor [Syntrophales bacterium]
MKVFIVDDSEVVCDGLESMLSEIKGLWLIGKAQDVRGAVEAIQRLEPDFVILDIRLIDGSGIDVLREIKKMEPSPVVLVLTNYPYPQYRKKCQDLGAEYFLDKVTEIDKIPGIFDIVKANAL